jgi:hypothetical protein
MDWTYAFTNPCEPQSFHESYSSSVLPDKYSTLQLYQSERWMKCYALEKWESTLNLCSCPWKRCRPSRKLLAKWWSVCWILSVSFKLILCSYGSDHAILIQYVWKKFIPVPRQFLAGLSICCRRSTTHLSFYLVLPSSLPLVSRGYLPLHFIILTLLK